LSNTRVGESQKSRTKEAVSAQGFLWPPPLRPSVCTRFNPQGESQPMVSQVSANLASTPDHFPSSLHRHFQLQKSVKLRVNKSSSKIKQCLPALPPSISTYLTVLSIEQKGPTSRASCLRSSLPIADSARPLAIARLPRDCAGVFFRWNPSQAIIHHPDERCLAHSQLWRPSRPSSDQLALACPLTNRFSPLDLHSMTPATYLMVVLRRP
jgi:hypothetical protein